jgi:hypothetical protein
VLSGGLRVSPDKRASSGTALWETISICPLPISPKDSPVFSNRVPKRALAFLAILQDLDWSLTYPAYAGHAGPKRTRNLTP